MKASANRKRGHRVVVVPMRATTVSEVPVDPELAARLKAAGEAHRAAEAERDRLVVEAVKATGTLREVAALVGLSHVSVLGIVKRAK